MSLSILSILHFTMENVIFSAFITIAVSRIAFNIEIDERENTIIYTTRMYNFSQYK